MKYLNTRQRLGLVNSFTSHIFSTSECVFNDSNVAGTTVIRFTTD